ncbi:NAD-binding protein [Streptomyces sp. NPDC007095]|jgi:pyruvate/2-oxoglutarate dehydrogenase complex dihydrolipoamide dehydrogenase (E3) component|uniref:NAD-binding protein n=1 Tax=Streptomyces sp. NPDC007095 TaxID=3154482 RepID=UPI000CC0B463
MGDTFEVMRSIEERQPAKAVVIGAGCIGPETAEALTTRGIQVTQIEALPEVLPTVDPEPGSPVCTELVEHGLEAKARKPGTGSVTCQPRADPVG